MERFFFLDNYVTKRNYDVPSEVQPQVTITKVKYRKWNFRVLMTQPILPNEMIALTGDCHTLGNWLPSHCILLKRESTTNIWSNKVRIPANTSYRYLVCVTDTTHKHVYVRRWETHLEPRTITDFDNSIGAIAKIDIFGNLNGLEKIDRGWLTAETIIQFKFYNNPIMLKPKLANRLLYVKLTPLNSQIQTKSSMGDIEESMPIDTVENGGKSPTFAFAEVCSLKYENSTFEPQLQFGRALHRDDILIFNVTIAEPDKVAYLIDFYTYSSRAAPSEPPFHFGYHYILPNVLRKSGGSLQIPITCVSKHRPMGVMNVDYMKITPLKHVVLTMKESYNRHWNRDRLGLDIGHRGSGTSNKASEISIALGNTIASLKKAADHGADMVEFNVQLSKDLVPVIYHDYNVFVSLKRRKPCDNKDMLELPVNELSLEQLKTLKVCQSNEISDQDEEFLNNDVDDHQLFPQLTDALNSIDINVGFNIVVKWSMRHKDGSLEFDRSIDKNVYVDYILETLLLKASSRRIVISCFDPDMCAMLRFKQNRYPVLLLTQGNTEKNQQYNDPRCNSIQNAIFQACAMELLGIAVHTEELLKDSTLVNLTIDQGLILLCWGDYNNSIETIGYLKELGIHGIIYDKLHILSSEKKNVFVMDGVQNLKDLEREHLKIVRQTSQKPPVVVIIDNTTDREVMNLQNIRKHISLSTATSTESIN